MYRTRSAAPLSGAMLGVWMLACSGSSGTTTDVLTVSRAGTGSGTVSGNGIDCGSTCTSTLPAGTAVSLSAVAAGGSSFAAWSGCDSTSGAETLLRFSADGHCEMMNRSLLNRRVMDGLDEQFGV